jgi:hypothetical protein
MSRLKKTLKDDSKKAQIASQNLEESTAIKEIEKVQSEPNVSTERDITPCKTKEEFYEYAIDEFTKIEGKGVAGKPGEIYADCLGHPTIGVGHLVVHKMDVLGGMKYNKKTKRKTYHKPNPQAVAAYREKFIELPLLDNDGNPMSDEEKGQKYDRMISMMKAKRRGLTNKELWSIGMGHLDEDGMKQTFAKDVEKATNLAIEDHPDDFWNMPRSAQASLVHMYFWGKGKVAERLQSDENTTIGEQLPNAVRVGLKPNNAIRNLADEAKRDSFLLKQQIQPEMIPQQPSKPINFAKMNTGREL